MTTTTSILNHNVTLIRWHVGPNPDECGTVAFWQAALDQLYAQQPFRGLFDTLKLNVWHMDHPELDRRVLAKQWCLEDYDPNTPGFQVADGLTAAGIDLGLFPAGWTPGVYTGPYRPLTDTSRTKARKALSHEFGHWHQGQCRYGGADEVAKWIKLRFRELRPHQAAGDNEYEDWAECYRAMLGTDECRGFFSDGKIFSPSVELYSLMRCTYWLQGNLAGLKVHDFTPQAGGVVYQALYGVAWKWRFIGNDWRSQEWTGSAWKFI